MEYGSNGWSVFLVPARISSDLAGIRYTAADEEEKGRFLLLFPTSTLYWMACGTSHQITLASINMTAKSSHAQHICRRVIFFPFERTWRRYHSSQLRVGFVLFKVLNGRKWGDWRGRWPLREPRSTFCKRNIFVACMYSIHCIHPQLMGDYHPPIMIMTMQQEE